MVDTMAAESSSPSLISAAVLAAGSARRMGNEKVLLAIESAKTAKPEPQLTTPVESV